MSEAKNKTSDSCDESNWTLLLERFYGEFYTPVYWEEEKKSKNFFAQIGRGTKYLFKRDFLRRHYIDDAVVFKKKDLKENTIVEQRCTFVHGSKEEVTFGGFFVIHHKENGIFGEEISQKQALEYFDCVDMLPENTEENKNSARVEIGKCIRKFMREYGDELVSQVLVDVLNDYFPDTD